MSAQPEGSPELCAHDFAVQVLFEEFDVDGDGLLTVEETGDVLAELGLVLNDVALTHAVRSMLPDGHDETVPHRELSFARPRPLARPQSVAAACSALTRSAQVQALTLCTAHWSSCGALAPHTGFYMINTLTMKFLTETKQPQVNLRAFLAWWNATDQLRASDLGQQSNGAEAMSAGSQVAVGATGVGSSHEAARKPKACKKRRGRASKRGKGKQQTEQNKAGLDAERRILAQIDYLQSTVTELEAR